MFQDSSGSDEYTGWELGNSFQGPDHARTTGILRRLGDTMPHQCWLGPVEGTQRPAVVAGFAVHRADCHVADRRPAQRVADAVKEARYFPLITMPTLDVEVACSRRSPQVALTF